MQTLKQQAIQQIEEDRASITEAARAAQEARSIAQFVVNSGQSKILSIQKIADFQVPIYTLPSIEAIKHLAKANMFELCATHGVLMHIMTTSYNPVR